MEKTLFAVAALAGVLTFSGAAVADAYPGKPVRVVVRAAGIRFE
jgi:tripartite-type tricarboxylate transporter receptor subunit TctC